MHNYLAANGGQVSYNTLPVLSGFREQIEALQNTLSQPEAEQSMGKYATLGDAYADSVANGETFGLGFSGDEVDRQQEIAQLSTDGTDARSGENDATSPIVPIAGGLYYNTETGEYVDNYNYEGNESAAANGSAGEGSGVSDGDNSGGGVTNADDSSSGEETTQDVGQSEELDSERVKELMELIRNYKSDELNSVIDPNSFNNKYPEGENALLGWQEELIGLIGEEHYNEYMDSYADWVPFDNQAQQKYNEFVDEQEKRKQLSDLEIKREELLHNMEAGTPTTRDIVQLGEIDAQIKELSQELGLGAQEYTPGVEGGWQEETEQEEKRPFETPIDELTLDELDQWKDLKLEGLNDEIYQQMKDEIASIPAMRAALKQQYIDWYRENADTQSVYMNKFGLNTAEEYAEEKLRNWDAGIEAQIRDKYAQMYQAGEAAVEWEYDKYNTIIDHKPIMEQKAVETEDMIQQRKEEGGLPYQVINTSDVAIDQDTIDNIMAVVYGEMGDLGESYQDEYNAGNIEIHVKDINEYDWTQDEAINHYGEELAERDEAISSIIGLLGSIGSVPAMVISLGSMLLQGDEVTEETALFAIETLESADEVDGAVDAVVKAAKNSLKGFVVEKGAVGFLQTLDSLYSVFNIAGGHYMELEIVQSSPSEDSYLPLAVQTVRLYEVDGTYIYDGLNSLCSVSTVFG